MYLKDTPLINTQSIFEFDIMRVSSQNEIAIQLNSETEYI